MSDDIGPIPDANAAKTPTENRDAAGGESISRVRPDTADPAVEGAETTPTENGKATAALPGAQINPNGPITAAPNEDQKKTGPGSGPEKCWAVIDYSKSREDVDKAITECMKTKYGETLVTDMNNAELLLSYITRNGLQEDKEVNDEVIQTLIDTRQHMRTGVFDSKTEEKNFRKSYGIIAKAAEPVTVVSLRDSTLNTARFRPWFFGKGQERKISEIACLNYRRWAWLVLLLLLGAQIYWTATSSILGKTDALISELNKAPTKAYYIDQENIRRGLDPRTLTRATPPVLNAAAPTSSPATESKAEKPPLTLDEIRTKRAELEANYSILDKFMGPFHWLYFKPPNKSDGKDKPKATPTSPSDTASPAKEDKDKVDSGTMVAADEKIFTPTEFQNTSASTRTVASQLLDVMQKWLLPLLYGAMGAMVFVVRTLSVQARDRLFRQEARVSLVLRVFLGMISGLAIGWFWSSGPQPSSAGGAISVSTLSPFALAFVAGYGVELFFALLDKIVSTFTNKP